MKIKIIKDNTINSLFEQGDFEGAIKSLYKNSWPSIKRHVLLHSGDKSQAEDLFHDAVMKLFLRIKEGKLDPNEDIGAYLFVIAKNTWISRVQRDSKIQLVEDVIKFNTATQEENTEDAVTKAKAINDALMNIGDTCRDLLKMTFYMGKSLTEAAEVLGLSSVDVAKTYQHRCKKKLKEQLKDNWALKELMTL